MYAFSENFILPISHDEVVHGKCSLINKMPGDYDQKFDALRAYMTYIMAHPGKKLMFMGQEFAQFIEWDFKKELDWFLLGFEKHKKMHDFVKELNKFYKEHKELYEVDFEGDGFSWISGEDYSQNVICFRRIAKDGEEISVVCNFAPIERADYRIGVKEKGSYKTLFCSDWEKFGGSTAQIRKGVQSEKISMHNMEYSVSLNLPPMSVSFFKKFKTKK